VVWRSSAVPLQKLATVQPLQPLTAYLKFDH